MASREFRADGLMCTTLAELTWSGVAAGMHRLNCEPGFRGFLSRLTEGMFENISEYRRKAN